MTAAVLLAFGFGAFLAVRAWVGAESPAARRLDAARGFLAGLADEIEGFRRVRGRLPQTLAELRDPSLPSLHDAQPWDTWSTPIDYAPSSDGASFRLRSRGPDKTPDTADDLVWPQGEPWK